MNVDTKPQPTPTIPDFLTFSPDIVKPSVFQIADSDKETYQKAVLTNTPEKNALDKER